jgi:hypothetical protein
MDLRCVDMSWPLSGRSGYDPNPSPALLSCNGDGPGGPALFHAVGGGRDPAAWMLAATDRIGPHLAGLGQGNPGPGLTRGAEFCADPQENQPPRRDFGDRPGFVVGASVSSFSARACDSRRTNSILLAKSARAIGGTARYGCRTDRHNWITGQPAWRCTVADPAHRTRLLCSRAITTVKLTTLPVALGILLLARRHQSLRLAQTACNQVTGWSILK